MLYVLAIHLDDHSAFDMCFVIELLYDPDRSVT